MAIPTRRAAVIAKALRPVIGHLQQTSVGRLPSDLGIRYSENSTLSSQYFIGAARAGFPWADSCWVVTPTSSGTPSWSRTRARLARRMSRRPCSPSRPLEAEAAVRGDAEDTIGRDVPGRLRFPAFRNPSAASTARALMPCSGSEGDRLTGGQLVGVAHGPTVRHQARAVQSRRGCVRGAYSRQFSHRVRTFSPRTAHRQCRRIDRVNRSRRTPAQVRHRQIALDSSLDSRSR